MMVHVGPLCRQCEGLLENMYLTCFPGVQVRLKEKKSLDNCPVVVPGSECVYKTHWSIDTSG